MSTFISDLPGAQDELNYNETNYIDEQEQLQQQQPQQPQQFEQEEVQEDVVAHKEKFEQNENIKVTYKKKKGNSSYFELIKNEFNEENLLILVLIFIATLSQSNEYIRKGLFTFGSSGFSHTSITLIKCLLLLLVFIAFKKFFQV
jgi:hypothetical protein